jgi:hypothetical protein
MTETVTSAAGRAPASMTLLIAPGTHLISVRGDLEGRAGRFVERELDRLLRGGAAEVVVDLVDTDGLDARAVAAIAAAGRRHGGEADLTIVCEDTTVLHLLGLAGATRHFHLAPGLGEAFGRLARTRLRPAA